MGVLALEELGLVARELRPKNERNCVFSRMHCGLRTWEMLNWNQKSWLWAEAM